MKTNRKSFRSRFQLEGLEERVALSHMGAVVDDNPHHNRGGNPAEIHGVGNGADDAAGHDAGEHKGGAGETVHHQRGR